MHLVPPAQPPPKTEGQKVLDRLDKLAPAHLLKGRQNLDLVSQ